MLERINEERSLYDALFARAMRLATLDLRRSADDRMLYVEGAASLLDDATGLTLQTLQALLQMIEEKQRLRAAAERIHRRPGPDRRHRRRTSRSEPAAVQPGRVDLRRRRRASGTIGVIGPTRMRYSRAIAVVDGAAQAVSRVLRDPN